MKVAGQELPGKRVLKGRPVGHGMSVWAKAVRFVYDDEQILLPKIRPSYTGQMISLGQHENRPVKTVRVGEKAGSIAQGVALTLSGKCESLCSASGSGKVLATPSSVPSMQAKSLSTLIRRVAWLSVSRSPPIPIWSVVAH
jgi:hypothetical protein